MANNTNLKIAVLQLSAVGISGDTLNTYLRTCAHQGVHVVLLGEYLLNRFYKEIQTLPVSMLKEQSISQVATLKELAKTYELTIVAPILQVINDKIYKTILRITPKRTYTYYQQILINYKHWNEEAFFDNKITALQEPMHFNMHGLKLAVLSGYELHFDELFTYIDTLGVDVLLVPTLSTFASHDRWRNLISMRAFTHGCYIVRANRIGQYEHENITWEFYGDSLACAPSGEILAHLGNYEEVLIVDIDKKLLKEAKSWGFRDAIAKRKKI